LWISVTRPVSQKERQAWIISEQQRLLGAAALRWGRDQTRRAQSQHTGSQQSSTTNWEVTTSPAAPATAEEMRKKQPLPARGKSLQLTHPRFPLPLAYWSGY